MGNGSGYYRMPLEVPMIPSGGFYASANDMAAFIRHHMANADALQTMYTIPYPIHHQTEGYALGVVRTDKYNTYYLNHNGGGFGFVTSLTWYPELKLGVVVLTNTDDEPAGYVVPTDLGMDILDATIKDASTVYHDRQVKMPRTAKPSISDATLETKLVSDIQQGLLSLKGKPMPDDARLRGYTGTYTATAKGIPFFYGIANLTVQYDRLCKDGGALTEAQPGLFFDGAGEALDLRGGVQTFRNIRLHKLPLGMAFIDVLPVAFFLLFGAAIVMLIVRRKKTRGAGRLAAAARATQCAGAGIHILFVAALVMMLLYFLAQLNGQAPPAQLFRVLAAAVLSMRILTPLALLAAAAVAVFCVLAWVKKWWRKFDRISYTCYTALGILYMLFLLRMNVLIF